MSHVKAKYSVEKTCILFFHGGPGLSSAYFEPFINFIKPDIDKNFSIFNLNLPNHGNNYSLNFKKNNYIDYINQLTQSINDKLVNFSKFYLVAHSFGAQLILESICRFSFCKKKLKGIIFMSLPYTKMNSEEYIEKKKLILDKYDPSEIKDLKFLEYWKLILPLYFYHEFSHENETLYVNKLTKDLSWESNKWLADENFNFFELAQSCRSKLPNIPMAYMEGDHDIVVPDNNYQTILNDLNPSSYIKIPNSGHFFFLENKLQSRKFLIDFILDSE